jgi:hypothetical protein
MFDQVRTYKKKLYNDAIIDKEPKCGRINIVPIPIMTFNLTIQYFYQLSYDLWTICRGF